MFSYLHQPKGFYKRLFLLALPVIVQNFITTSLGFLDTFMVGLLGSDQMSAVTVANVPVFIIQLIVFGLQSGSSVLISQYWAGSDFAWSFYTAKLHIFSFFLKNCRIIRSILK